MKNFEQHESGSRQIRSLTLRADLFGAAAGMLTLRVAGAGLAFLCSILIARLTDPESYGSYALVMAGASVMGTFASLGLPLLVTREAATALAQDRHERIRVLAMAALSLVAMAAILLAVPALTIAASGLVAEHVSLEAFALGVLLALLLAINEVRAGILRGLHAVLRSALPDLLLRPLVVLTLAAGLYFGGWTLGTTGAVALEAIAILTAFLLGTRFLVQVVPPAGASLRPMPVAIDLARKTRPFWVITALAIIEAQAPLLLLGLLSEPAEAALFAVALQVTGIITIGLVSVIAPLQGRLVESWSRNELDECQRLVSQAARLSFMMAAPAVLLLVVAPAIVLQWFGEAYVAGAPILRLLLIGAFVNAALGPCRISLLVCGQQSTVLSGVLATVILTIIVAVLAIPVLDASGAAIAASAARIFWNVLFTILCRMKLGLRTDILHRRAWTRIYTGDRSSE